MAVEGEVRAATGCIILSCKQEGCTRSPKRPWMIPFFSTGSIKARFSGGATNVGGVAEAVRFRIKTVGKELCCMRLPLDRLNPATFP